MAVLAQMSITAAAVITQTKAAKEVNMNMQLLFHKYVLTHISQL